MLTVIEILNLHQHLRQQASVAIIVDVHFVVGVLRFILELIENGLPVSMELLIKDAS